ncbi:MAG: integral rane sensor signal transduction histidine kinase [Deltaproteobacteria bacterium]|nr:integral rane sensor signal transduction histidine kinase [Deltaproteobacteria bacterium]
MATLALAISRAPGWRELRSFALIAITAAAYCFFDLVHVVPVSPRTLRIGEGLALASCFLYGLAWIRHLAVSDRRPLRRMERGALVVAAVMVVLALIPGVLIEPPIRRVPVEWFGVTYTMATATPLGVACVTVMLITLLVAAFGGGRRWRDGWHAQLPMLGATALAVTGLSDTLAFMEIIAMPQLIEAVTVVVVGVMGVSYAHRFIADARRLEALSSKLEHEVAARTAELLNAQAVAAHHERLAGLGRIAAGVAHEINNPTMVIQQNLARMRALISDQAALTPELDARLESSRAATQHIAEIVRQLLETGRPRPVDPTNATAFSLAAVVAKAVAAASVTVPALGVMVSVSESLCARGSPRLVEQVLVNLLVNAAHATKDAPGGGRARIVGVRRGDQVHLCVTDNGPGIAAAVRDRLFEPLFVARSTSEGTEMALELPAADAIDAAPGTAADVLGAAAPDRGIDLRVLIIDDNDDLRELLVLQLDRFFHVDAAPTVEQALAMVANGPPYDVVLCDLMMPSGGAESWLARCNALDPRLGERTILLTAGPTTDAATQLVEVRREKVLFKPADLADLRPMIERIARPG